MSVRNDDQKRRREERGKTTPYISIYLALFVGKLPSFITKTEA